jgi:hypothetical protein
MEAYNKENVITNAQIELIISLLGEDYFPRRIAIFKNRFQYIVYHAKKYVHLYEIITSLVLFSHETEFYSPFYDRVEIFIYNHHEQDKIDLQYETVYSLVHCLRMRHYYYDYLKEEDIGWDVFQLSDICHSMELVLSDQYGVLMERFDKDFMTQNAEKIAAIMNWDEVLYPKDETADDEILGKEGT